jgi:hypothetical protein
MGAFEEEGLQMRLTATHTFPFWPEKRFFGVLDIFKSIC